MAFNINGFQGALAGGGARPNLFQVMVHNPVNLSQTLQSAFMIQASSIPESTLGVATQNYFGRPIKFAGRLLLLMMKISLFVVQWKIGLKRLTVYNPILEIPDLSVLDNISLLPR